MKQIDFPNCCQINILCNFRDQYYYNLSAREVRQLVEILLGKDKLSGIEDGFKGPFAGMYLVALTSEQVEAREVLKGFGFEHLPPFRSLDSENLIYLYYLYTRDDSEV